MSASAGSLVLGALALVLGLWPLWPAASPLALVGTALGLPLALVALGLGLSSRGQALRRGNRLGLPTAALSVAVAATVLCTAWLLGVVVLHTRPRPHPPRALPVDRTATLGPIERSRYAALLTTYEHPTHA